MFNFVLQKLRMRIFLHNNKCGLKRDIQCKNMPVQVQDWLHFQISSSTRTTRIHPSCTYVFSSRNSYVLQMRGKKGEKTRIGEDAAWRTGDAMERLGSWTGGKGAKGASCHDDDDVCLRASWSVAHKPARERHFSARCFPCTPRWAPHASCPASPAT